MPKRKRSNGYRSKKRAIKKFRRRLQLNPTAGLSLSGGPLRRRVRTIHQYSTFISLDQQAGMATHYFSANGMYDPDITGTGHQPMGFDEMAEMYDHYVVIASQITVRGRPKDIIATLRITDAASAPADSTDLLEHRTTHDKLLGYDDKIVRLSKRVCPQKFLGSRKQMMDDIYKGTASANPAEQCYYEVGAVSAYGASLEASYFRIDITYVAIWIEPKKLVGS